MTTPFSSYVIPGACVQGTELLRCALDASFCDFPSQFLSPRELEGAVTSPGYACLAESTTELMLGSRCPESDICTNDITACSGDLTKEDDACTVSTNVDMNVKFTETLYAACEPRNGDDAMCVYDSNRCPESWDFIGAMNTKFEFDSFCTCPHVRTGACLHHEEYTCAVSVDACGPDELFVPILDLLEESNVECYLCPAPEEEKDEEEESLLTSAWNAIVVQLWGEEEGSDDSVEMVATPVDPDSPVLSDQINEVENKEDDEWENYQTDDEWENYQTDDEPSEGYPTESHEEESEDYEEVEYYEYSNLVVNTYQSPDKPFVTPPAAKISTRKKRKSHGWIWSGIPITMLVAMLIWKHRYHSRPVVSAYEYVAHGSPKKLHV